MSFEILFGREDDGRWIAEIEALPGVLAYGNDPIEAQARVDALAFQVTGLKPEDI